MPDLWSKRSSSLAPAILLAFPTSGGNRWRFLRYKQKDPMAKTESTGTGTGTGHYSTVRTLGTVRTVRTLEF